MVFNQGRRGIHSRTERGWWWRHRRVRIMLAKVIWITICFSPVEQQLGRNTREGRKEKKRSHVFSLTSTSIVGVLWWTVSFVDFVGGMVTVSAIDISFVSRLTWTETFAVVVFLMLVGVRSDDGKVSFFKRRCCSRVSCILTSILVRSMPRKVSADKGILVP